ncbi:uncharacterized protein LOC132306486 [Cornus florida]|uniref:uncharacterized protein LOC132306486 n=1 Tax=Cornus florida TaxID=4283 RepID=UPI0028A17990|nr:uncharacterized protein LOC132306486 [Cornus florida]
MGKRKGLSETSETLISRGRGDDEMVAEEEKGGFFACYLLTSLSPRHKGHTYIGFTVNPRRRIRQHNGEISCGAWRTKTKRPWEMVLCIYGFPTNVSALQFEWAWQHPHESVAVRKAAVTFKTLSGIANKIKLAYTMLTLPSWQSLNLKVNFFSTKYMKHSAGCPSLPDHMKVQFGSMDDLPCYSGSDYNAYENEDGWDDGDKFEGTGIACGFTEEKITDLTASNYADYQKRFEETTYEQNGGRIEDFDTGQASDPLVSEDHRQPDRVSNFPAPLSSAFVTSTCSVLETVEDDDMLGLVEQSSVKVDLPTTKQLTSIAAAGKDEQPPINRHTVPHKSEVIDLSSPSPGYRISFRSKKIRVSTICPEIVDLT